MTRITRDAFDTAEVLAYLKAGQGTPEETARLLEEACHALQRERVRLANATLIVANLQQSLRWA